MSKINSKQKGNSNERECCKSLQLWTGQPFNRVPCSGALRWKEAESIAADIICGTKDFDYPFVTETKHLKKFSYALVLRENSWAFTLWNQVMFDAIRARKLPLAMIRYNGLPKFKHKEQAYQNYMLILDWKWGGSFISHMLGGPAFLGKVEDYELVGFPFSQVIKLVKFKELVAFVRERGLVEQFTLQYPIES